MKAKTSICALSLSVMALFFANPVMAAKTTDLFEMMDQFDKSDKQDFQAAIDKANACTRVRDFPCSASELARAAKAANSGQDKKTLRASQNNLANEKQQLANEIRQAEEAARRVEEERQAQIRRDEEREEARVRREEEMQARLEWEEHLAREAEGRQSARDSYAALGTQIRQQFAAAATVLGNMDCQTHAAMANANRVLAAQAADRDRARAEREDREADRRRDAERERAARADAERSAARSRVAAAQPELPRYQPQVVTIPTWRQTCPPGSSPMRHSNGVAVTNPAGAACVKDAQSAAGQATVQGQTRVASNSGSSASSDRPVSASGTTERPLASGSSSGSTRSDSPTPTTSAKPPSKIQWGPVKPEAIAICRQSTKNGKWECNGALDNQTIVDEPTLESALARQYCSGGTWAAGGPTIKGVQWDAYRCGHSLGAGDYDVAKKHGLITTRRSYMCPLYGEDRCTTLYDGQDKR